MIPTLTDVAGHVGYAFLAIGILLLARGSIWGWVWRLAGEVVWLAIGVSINMTSIWFWGTIFLAIEVYGFRSWRAARKKAPHNADST